MVKLHRAEVPSVIPVKRPRRSSLLTRTPVCLWPGCGAALAHDDVPHIDRGNPRLELIVSVEPGCERVVWERKKRRR